MRDIGGDRRVAARASVCLVGQTVPGTMVTGEDTRHGNDVRLGLFELHPRDAIHVPTPGWENIVEIKWDDRAESIGGSVKERNRASAKFTHEHPDGAARV